MKGKKTIIFLLLLATFSLIKAQSSRYLYLPTNNQTTINIESFTAGTYNVILIVDGIAEDSKSLIIQ